MEEKQGVVIPFVGDCPHHRVPDDPDTTHMASKFEAFHWRERERQRLKTRKDPLVRRVFCQYTTKTKYGPWLSAFDMNTQEDDTISNFGALYEQQEDDASMMCLMLN